MHCSLWAVWFYLPDTSQLLASGTSDIQGIRPIKEGLDAAGVDYRMMVLPDHPTPIKVRTHTSDPVPYMLYDSTAPESHTWNYNEKEAKASGNYIAQGHEGLDHLLGRKTC